MSVGLWPGRWKTSNERSRSSIVSPSCSTRVTSARAPQARNARETDCSALTTSSGMPWRSITSRANASSASASSEKRSTNGTAASIAATSAPECEATSETRPRWSMCWWVRITSPMSSSEWPEARDPAGELVEGGARVGAGVHQRQRLVLDQVDVHAADRERGGDGQAVDARLGRGREGIGAHARISASTSSRFSSMCSRERSDSRLSRSSGSVFDGRTLKCQSS